MEKLTFLQPMWQDFIHFIPNLITAIVIFLATIQLARQASRLVLATMDKRKINKESAMLVSRLAEWAILIFGTVTALAQVNFDLTAFIAGLGILGFTVGFALQDISQNFVAGMLLLFQQPFKIGNMVEVSDQLGIVADIQIRSTTIHTLDGLLVIIPNSHVYGKKIINFSETTQRQVSIAIGVAYHTDLAKVNELLVEVARRIPGVQSTPPPIVLFKEFANNSINGTLNFWIDNNQVNYYRAIDSAIRGIKRVFEKEKINHQNQ